ncbi:sensor histidine kinase [Streptomyces catenulae]|uniref:histidine kinase n=1 Tax=Streptomyces catenulae TaxID=66875 RepID=A0ABV2YZE2_9ACTN|nr:histidine kinase [Streptomyces catenulae]
MIRAFRPLLRGSTYTGALFACGGALVSLPLLPLALAPVLAGSVRPETVAAASALALWAVLTGALGLAHPVRRVLIMGARRLLRVPLPDPLTAPSGADRLRTPLWLVLHAALGWSALLLTGMLTTAGLILPGNWLGAQGGITAFGWSARLTGGWGSWAAALGCLLLAATVCVAVTAVLRRLAPALLGPSASERLALAAERERRLAERNQLARELHDSIGHALTATTIQAAVAGEVLATDPVAARAALRSIEDSSRGALEDLDYVLGVLRDQAADTAPTRTLADLPELLERLRHAGAVLEPHLPDGLTRIRGTLSRAAYRIVQEALTNALRHGADGPIRIRVTTTPDLLELSVVNPTGERTGTGPAAFPTSGRGLAGLAERVHLLHGRFEAGPDGARQWRLTVRLPLRLPA